MIEGMFDIAIDTPKYHKRGTISLKSAENRIVALLSAGEMRDLELRGTCEGQDFEFAGTETFGDLGEITFTAKGNTWGSSISAVADTSIGRVEVFGTRLSTSAGELKSSHEYLMKASTGEFDANDNTMYSGLYADGG